MDGKPNCRNEAALIQIPPAQCGQGLSLCTTFPEQDTVVENNFNCKFAYGGENSVMEIMRQEIDSIGCLGSFKPQNSAR